MQIKRVEFRNFGSYGNKLMTLEIPEDPSFFLIQGKNGHGKSTLSDVIKFAIFGKLENKNLKDMPNRLNKNAYVKIEMITKQGLVEVERGLEPNFFKLKINSKEVDKAGKKSVQAFLEEELLEMSFYVFSNTLSLSINDFKSFLRMTTFDKKNIIDKIFGLQILNQMREILKYQTKKLKENVESLNTSISAFTKSLESSQKEYSLLENKIKVSTTEKKEKLEAEKILYESKIEKYSANLDKISKKLNNVQELRKKITESIGGDRQLLANIQEKIELYQNSKCPMCETKFDTDFHHDLLEKYKVSQNESAERYSEKEIKNKELGEQFKKLDSLKIQCRNELSSTSVKLNYCEAELKQIVEDNTDEQSSSLKNMIEEFTKNIEEKKDEQNKTQKSIAFYNLTEEILGEKGVKQLAIKSILPPLNTEVSKLIKTLGIEHKIVFNEEFDAKLTHFGIEVSVDTLSTGEMKKVDFAVLLAVIRMMKMKYPFMNMLFLDEIFSSIDADGQYHILKILRDIVRDYKMNIFVISHYPLSYTEFDYRLDIIKSNGFSNFEIFKTE